MFARINYIVMKMGTVIIVPKIATITYLGITTSGIIGIYPPQQFVRIVWEKRNVPESFFLTIKTKLEL